jgi:hypothetical protein
VPSVIIHHRRAPRLHRGVVGQPGRASRPDRRHAALFDAAHSMSGPEHPSGAGFRRRRRHRQIRSTRHLERPGSGRRSVVPRHRDQRRGRSRRPLCRPGRSGRAFCVGQEVKERQFLARRDQPAGNRSQEGSSEEDNQGRPDRSPVFSTVTDHDNPTIRSLAGMAGMAGMAALAGMAGMAGIAKVNGVAADAGAGLATGGRPTLPAKPAEPARASDVGSAERRTPQ